MSILKKLNLERIALAKRRNEFPILNFIEEDLETRKRIVIKQVTRPTTPL